MFKFKSLIASAILFSATSFAADIPATFTETVIEIDQHKVSSGYLNQFAKNHISRRFYHGKPPENEQNTFMLTMANQYIDQFLFAQEATRLNILPDSDHLEQAIADFTEKNQQDPNWQQAKQYYLPMLTQLTNQKNQVASLKSKIFEQAKVSPNQVKQFFDDHPEKFTQPPQIRASIILLSVNANARGFVWQATVDQAKAIIEKIDNGESFATLAELHSTDPTADTAGDMGFLHQGMIAKKAEEAMTKLDVGQHTQHIMLLEGVAIFKVTDRKPEQLHTFAEVEQRATALANQTAQELAWSDLLKQLRDKATIEIEQSKLLIQ